MPTFEEALEILSQNLEKIENFELTKTQILALSDGDSAHCPLCQANLEHGDDYCKLCPANHPRFGKICKKVCEASVRYESDKIRRHHFTAIYKHALLETMNNFENMLTKS